MQDRAALRRLQTLAELIRDRDCSQLAKHIQRCNMLRQRILDLTLPALPGDTVDVAGEQALLRYSRWADPQRIRLNTALATAMAGRLQAEQTARGSFGRAEVLARLCDRDHL